MINDHHYKCISTGSEGRQYNEDHEWYAQTTFFNITYRYICANCELKLSRREWRKGNYVLFKDKKDYGIYQ
jgi:exoribonuclease II